ncbi:MAG: hypothetical protein Q8R36_04405 [bacterium]|nr:hypothetical protein [bacterium]
MTEIPAYFVTSTIITSLAFAACVWLIFHVTLRRTEGQLIFSAIVALVLFGWFIAVTVLGKINFFAINPLIAPGIIFGWLALFAVLRKIYLSPRAQAVADAIPVHWIILSQTYRVVGVGFINLYNLGLLPALFAFSAGYGDILVGGTAPFVAYWYIKKKPYSRQLAIIWNFVGIADLIVALSVGFLGFPRPIQALPLHPSTELLSLFPLALITLFAVPLAILLHLFSLRAIRKNG